ncbi:uncharacterized protein LOC125679133 [Ostrea edulis]|uniref:uncharacterized protein LOC125679133 n=1 Tax=Ostrea edulis TaxID=37623 RepID=UPI0024AEEE2B|nr:uncharacterized protein LOC125679133 [Ostrea edulis]
MVEEVVGKSEDASIEEATSAFQNLSLSPDEVATQNCKRRRKTRSRRTKTQSQIRRRTGASSGEHSKSHPKMSKKGSESAAAQSHKEPKAENKRPSHKRQRLDNPAETIKKRTKPTCSTGSN